jgi:diguanylate cyclase
MGETLGAGCVFARTGGDEFAILLPNHTADEAVVMRDRLRAALHAAGIAASIGVAERKPYRGIEDAWQRADQAMYADKAARKDAAPRPTAG